MSHLDLGDGVLYPRGGMFTLIEAVEKLARDAGVAVRTGADVVAIETEPVRSEHGGVRGLVAGRIPGSRPRARVSGVQLADGEVIPADVVVSGADRFHTETELLAPGLADHPAASWERRGPGISALLVMAGVRGELPELPHHSLFFTHDWPQNFADVLGDGPGSPVADLQVPLPASLYVSRTSATDTATSDTPAAPAGHENIFVLVPFPADERLGANGASQERLEALADAYLEQVGAWAGIPDLVGRVVTRRVVGPAHFHQDLHAWRGTALGMEHTLRQSAMMRLGNRSRRVDGLFHVGGGTIPGVGLPMCVISAELVAKQLLGETSSRPLPTPLRPGFLDASRRRTRA
ncbi:hypothetical protein GCM10025865_08420 [Paraoerskovia sediminicola]|uniref:Amine oxidase domain-containing protein n=1 Tax=Paraoerskovia sediminicola TaxID=1138587 RepID=A0ABM8G0J0_9CELL|nr:hypothetical protein GCM10025865_08420 [Paraoerskovia sediminicola]